MSQKELQRSERQVQRLKRRYRPDSTAWVQHGNRGRPMPWALPAALRQPIIELARGKYAGFNDSHLCEKLRSFESSLNKRLVDDHLGGDVRQFASLPCFHLLSHRLEVALHSVNAN